MLQEAILKLQRGVGLTDEELELLQDHYSILKKHLDLEGDRMLLQYTYCYQCLSDVESILFERTLVNKLTETK
jgi:hypothetical protein